MKKIRKIKNKRLNSKRILGLASLLVVGGLVSSCDSITMKRENEYSRIEFTSEGDYRETRQFKPFDSNNNKDVSNSFIYYGEWEQNNDKYERIVKEYDIKNKKYEDLSNINSEEIEKTLGKPEKTYIQVTKSLMDEEKERGSYYEATIYIENKERYVMVKDPERNKWILIACGTLIPIAAGSLVGWNRYNDKKEGKKLTLKK